MARYGADRNGLAERVLVLEPGHDRLLKRPGVALWRTRAPGINNVTSRRMDQDETGLLCSKRGNRSGRHGISGLAPVGPGRASGQDRADRPSPRPLRRPGPMIPPGRSTTSTTDKCSSYRRRRLRTVGPPCGHSEARRCRGHIRATLSPGDRRRPLPRRRGRRRSVVEQGTPSVETNALAHLVKIVAETDRGAFDQSLQSLRQAVAESMAERPATGARAALAPGEVIAICEVYYQRLVEANQFALASEAFRLVARKPLSSRRQRFPRKPSEANRPGGQASPSHPGNAIWTARSSTWPAKRENWSWSSSGQAGASRAPNRSPGSNRLNAPFATRD